MYRVTLQGTNILSHQGKRNIIFKIKTALGGDMLVPWRLSYSGDLQEFSKAAMQVINSFEEDVCCWMGTMGLKAYPSVIYTTTGTYLFCVPSFVAFDVVPIQVLVLDGLLSLLLHSHLLDAVRGRGSYYIILA